MATIVFKQINDMAFKLDKKVIEVKGNGILNVISDDELDEIMSKYGTFIKKRLITEKNPSGCFIINDNREKASAMSKEVGEVADKSAPVKVKKAKKK